MTPVEVAKTYLGQKEEANNVFKNSKFADKIHAAGQKDGEAWCAYFTELVFKEARPEKKEYDKLFSASAIQTYENFKTHGVVPSNTPSVNALAVWRKYVDNVAQWQGHIGVVSKVTPTGFESIEGNTNEAGSREGTTVMSKVHGLNFDTKTGLRLVGFLSV